MKKIIGLMAMVLSLALVLSLGFVGCKDSGEPIDLEKNFTPLMGKQTDWIAQNPDRGYRTEMVLALYDTAEDSPGLKNDWRYININNSDEEIKKTIQKLFDMYNSVNDKLTILYLSFNDCNDVPQIPDRYLEVISLYLDYCRAKGVRVLWRHSYGGTTNKYISNDEDRKYLEKVCADQEIMVSHIKQLGEFFKDHLDVIQKVSSGAIGNGELTASFQWPPVDFNVVIDAMVRYMCVPNGLQYTVRMPRYKMDLLNWWKENHNGEEYPYKDIVGYNNDAVYGETTKAGAHSGCWQIDHDPRTCLNGKKCYNYSEKYFDEWRWVTETCAYTSQSGEMFTNIGMTVINKIFPTGMDVIKQMAHHRHTCLSNWHTMGEKQDGKYGTADTNVMVRWVERETVTPELLDNNGIIYDPNWFVDENGSEIQRNPYEFLRDHLGYKIVADKATFKGSVGKGTTVNADLSFKNYGFAAAFFLESGYAVLNDRYEVVSTVKAGEPDKWISLPADYYVTEKTSSVQDDIISYNVAADITLPEESGKYYIAFYLKNGMEDFAALSNDIEFEEGYNILYEFEIK